MRVLSDATLAKKKKQMEAERDRMSERDKIQASIDFLADQLKCRAKLGAHLAALSSRKRKLPANGEQQRQPPPQPPPPLGDDDDDDDDDVDEAAVTAAAAAAAQIPVPTTVQELVALDAQTLFNLMQQQQWSRNPSKLGFEKCLAKAKVRLGML